MYKYIKCSGYLRSKTGSNTLQMYLTYHIRQPLNKVEFERAFVTICISYTAITNNEQNRFDST